MGRKMLLGRGTDCVTLEAGRHIWLHPHTMLISRSTVNDQHSSYTRLSVYLTFSFSFDYNYYYYFWTSEHIILREFKNWEEQAKLAKIISLCSLLQANCHAEGQHWSAAPKLIRFGKESGLSSLAWVFRDPPSKIILLCVLYSANWNRYSKCTIRTVTGVVAYVIWISVLTQLVRKFTISG